MRSGDDMVAVIGELPMGEIDANINETVGFHTLSVREYAPMMNTMPMNWVGDWVGQRRRMTPDRPALIEPSSGRQFTYAELDDRACRLGHWMIQTAGLRAGDVVAIISENRLEAIDAGLACGKTGVILAPVSHKLSPGEASALIDRLKPKYLLFDSGLQSFVDNLSGLVKALPSLAFGQTDSAYTKVLAASPPQPIQYARALQEPFLYIHTGGSTGLPKICRITLEQMHWNAIELLVAATDGLGRRRELLLFPLFHIGGWNTALPILLAGGCLVMPARFDVEESLGIIDQYAVNHFGAVEAMLRAMSASPAFADASLTSLEGITTAGAPCSEAAMAAFFERDIPVSQAYGLTEAGPSNFIQSRDGRSIAELRRDSQSIGQAFFHCDYRIVNPKTLAPVALGDVGELQMRSPHAFAGYLDDPEQTERRWTEDGWLRSGDLAREDNHQQVQLIGRLDHVIVSGGENIAAEELEAVLSRHPAVEAALAFGVPDDQWGERPVVWMQGPDPQQQGDIKAWLGEHLARFKQPRDLCIVEALPLTGAGKLDRATAKSKYLSQMHGDRL